MIIAAYILFFAALLASFAANYVHYMHMFQLNSYHASSQFKWIGANFGNVLLRHIFALGATAYMIIDFMNNGAIAASTLFIAAALLCFGLVFLSSKPAKKKLVFTPRVIRMCITSAVLYGAFCALMMIFFGGTLVLAAALPLWQIFSLFMPLLANLINHPIEVGVNRHYINDAKRIINGLPNTTVIGITGSYGKTSTKFYLQKLLSARYNVLMTPESYNTTMGVVKTIRGSLNATHDIFICEMGAKGVGEIKEICDIVHPKHSMITSIGPQHLESFKSLDNIIKTKFEIADCITDGTVFLNFDNEYIKNHEIDKNIVSYGLDGGKDFYADNISVSEKGTTFTVHTSNNQEQTFTTRLIGAHNVENVVGAISVAATLGIPLSELVIPVKRLECVPHRMEINVHENSVIIDDAFNSNPSGAKAALETLKLFDGVRILVTPGMVELGEKEYELNKELGAAAADCCDYAILVGEKQAVPINEGLIGAGFDREYLKIVGSLNEGLEIVNLINTGGRKKIILLENDLPDNY